MGGYGLARDLAPAEKHSYSFICSRDIEINMDGLPDYRVGKSADISQCHLIGRNVHVNRRKLYRVFNFNLKKRSCC